MNESRELKNAEQLEELLLLTEEIQEELEQKDQLIVELKTQLKDVYKRQINKIAAADMILFTTPVYWWGMSAQMKQIIDKCYCRGMQLKEKKIGVIVVGGSPTDNIQYELIRKQFECMASYLSWDVLFQKSYYANGKDELVKNVEAMEELENIGKEIL